MSVQVFKKGNMQRPTIVFIHGNSLSHKSFESQLKSIDQFALMAIDLPGHGLSSPANNPEEIYSLSGYANAVKNVIKEHNLSEYILVGHSLGGHVAIDIANDLPGLKGLLIFGTPPLGIPPNMAEAFLPNPVAPLLFQNNLTDNEVQLLGSAYIAASDKTEHLLADILEQIKSTDGNARSCLLQNIGAGDLQNETDIVKNLKLPLAILHGENDSVINPNYYQLLQYANLWENKIHIISESGHSPQMEQPERFNEILLRFCRHAFAV